MRETYSPVRVSTLMRVPSSTNKGTRTTATDSPLPRRLGKPCKLGRWVHRPQKAAVSLRTQVTSEERHDERSVGQGSGIAFESWRYAHRSPSPIQATAYQLRAHPARRRRRESVAVSARGAGPPLPSRLASSRPPLGGVVLASPTRPVSKRVDR